MLIFFEKESLMCVCLHERRVHLTKAFFLNVLVAIQDTVTLKLVEETISCCALFSCSLFLPLKHQLSVEPTSSHKTFIRRWITHIFFFVFFLR